MAQHIDIKNIEGKRFREIEKGILKAFSKGLIFIKGSLRFETLDKMYKENNEDLVFGVTYKIPYDKIICRSDEGYFEIHYNLKLNKVNKIYLVA